MEYIKDYTEQHAEYEARQERKSAWLPKCSECELPIVAEECFEFNGKLICPDCLSVHRRWTEDYAE